MLEGCVMTALPLRTALERSIALQHRPGGLTYRFEELPLVLTDDGFEAARIDGEAEIEFTGYYDFEVTEIKLDAARPSTPAERAAHGMWTRKKIVLDRNEHPQLWHAIARQLEFGTHKGLVESAIQNELDWS
jgi:hypothetical protein